MKIHRFFSDNPVQKGWTSITGPEFFHLKSVIRAQTDDTIEVVDGAGSLITGQIHQIKKNEARIVIKYHQKVKPKPVRLIVAPAVFKKKPMALMIEKLTEMGVEEIRPIEFIRSDERYSPAQINKWHKIAQQSLKINKNLWVTKIYPPVNIASVIQFSKEIPTKILLDITGGSHLPDPLGQPTLAVIGPPGDYTPEEREEFVANNFIPLKINTAILKSETAAIAIAAVLSHRMTPTQP
jgi:16S rRNA (uracil1498-N3)-methyltransferase